MSNIFNSFVLTLADADFFDKVGSTILSFLYKFLITIDAVVYYTIDLCYQVFLALSRVRLFKNDVFEPFLRRFYVLVGVLMMFFVVYSLLKVIANPDDMTKGNMAPGKVVSNIFSSIIIIVLLPTIFNFIYQVQNVVLGFDLIGKIVIGGANPQDNELTVQKGGREIAVQVFSAFFYPDEEYFDEETRNEYHDGLISLNDKVIAQEGKKLSLSQAKEQFKDGNVSFWVFADFSKNAAEGQIKYFWIISTIAGGFCLYVMINFVFDIGQRAVRLAVLQIIGPVPTLMRVLPGKEKTFSSWVSLTASTFFEVFIRVFLIYLVAFLVAGLDDIMNGLSNVQGVTTPVRMLAQAFIVMGIVAFAKQAPKMLSDLFGIKTGNMGLSLKQRMQQGGGFLMGSALGAGASAAVRNGYVGGKNIGNKFRKTSETFKDKNATTGDKVRAVGGAIGSVFGTAGSILAGGLSGSLRGGYAGRNAKTFGDMRDSASKGSQDAVNKRNYRDQHPIVDYKLDKEGRRIAKKDKDGKILKDKDGNTIYEKTVNPFKGGGGTVGAALRDAGRSISAWATGRTPEQIQKDEKFAAEAQSKESQINSKIKSKIEDNYSKVIVRDKEGNIQTYVDTDGTLKVKTLATLDYQRKELQAQLSTALSDSERAEVMVKIKAIDQEIKDAEKDAISMQFNAEKYDNIGKAVIFDKVDEDFIVKSDGTVSMTAQAQQDAIRVDGVTSMIKDYESFVASHSAAIINNLNDQYNELMKQYVAEATAEGGPNEFVVKALNDRAENISRLMKHMKDFDAEDFTFDLYGVVEENNKKVLKVIEKKTSAINAKKLADSWEDQKNIYSEALLDLKIKQQADSGKKDK